MLDVTRDQAQTLSGDLPGTPARWDASRWTFAQNGSAFWVKDIRRSAGLFRYVFGRMMLRREARIYEKLGRQPFVPRFVGRFDSDSIVLERLEGRSLSSFRDATDLSDDFIESLQGCIDELHRRGIVHLDLRHRSNIFVDTSGRPMIVDFETALYLGSGVLSARWMLPFFAWVDHSAVIKFRRRYFPDLVSPDDDRRYRRFRRLRRLWPFGRVWPLRRKVPG